MMMMMTITTVIMAMMVMLVMVVIMKRTKILSLPQSRQCLTHFQVNLRKVSNFE